MKTRRSVAIVFAAALFLACGDDPFNPGQNDDSMFYPLAVGNTWSYVRFGTYNIDSLSYTIVGSSTVSITGTAEHSGGFQVFVEETMVSDTIQGLMVVETADTSYVRVSISPVTGGSVWKAQTMPAMSGKGTVQLESVDERPGYPKNPADVTLT